MHEKILIPPAVHDKPHFAKKTLVLAVLLSATSMFATAASVNVVTGQTYQDDVDVKAPDTFTNAGTVKNQTITVAGSSKAAFHNTGIIETGTLTLDGIQGLEIGGESITATKGIVVKGIPIPGVNSLKNMVTVGKIVTPELKLIGTANEYGLLFNSTEQNRSRTSTGSTSSATMAVRASSSRRTRPLPSMKSSLAAQVPRKKLASRSRPAQRPPWSS